MYNMAPISPLWLLSDFRNWGQEARYYEKNDLIALIAQGIPRFLGTESQELWMKSNIYDKYVFDYLNNQIYIFNNSQYCIGYEHKQTSGPARPSETSCWLALTSNLGQVLHLLKLRVVASFLKQSYNAIEC